MQQEIANILQEDARREAERAATFNPITGEGSLGDRFVLDIPGLPFPMHLPMAMQRTQLVRALLDKGSVRAFVESLGVECTEDEANKVLDMLSRLRFLHDFPFWAAATVKVKDKVSGAEVPFWLNHPQRKLVAMFEALRSAGLPIRVILLKARQWGGSTVTQIYMAWLQLIHRKGLNSLIVGHVLSTSVEVRDMYERLINNYPARLLHSPAEQWSETEAKWQSVGNMQNIKRVISRDCKIKLGTAEKPDGARGGDYSLIHCTEVGLWRATDGKTPEDIIQSACSGVLFRPYTMIVYESTAKGTGNFFHREYAAAKDRKSQFRSIFISWFEIDWNISQVQSKEGLATMLWQGRNQETADDNRHEPGRYLWWLWKKGATLQNIQWYINERAKYNSHASMASECPTDDIEAFVHSGDRVFDVYEVDELRKRCKDAPWRGELTAKGREGEEALQDIKFVRDDRGDFQVWSMPEVDEEERITDRYVVAVDIGGRSTNADYSVICVFDRIYQMDGDGPVVVAQWYGHCDMDVLAWRAARIARWYDDALLVIESNTLETKDRDRIVDGDQAPFILEEIKGVYDNLYARRRPADDIRDGKPAKYGWHTNVATKPIIISELIRIVREGLYTERDQRCCDELITYERKPNGAYGAIIGRHDDLLMTRAIGLHIAFKEMPLPTVAKRGEVAPKKRVAISEATI